MQKTLFVCNDYIGSTMAGPGIRYWEMAHALERKGHQAVLLTRYLENGFSQSKITFTGKTSFKNLISWIRWTDCIVLPGSPLAIVLAVLLHKKLIFDQYDPVIFEFLERKTRTFYGRLYKTCMLVLWKVRQRIILRFGEGFLVANEKQKDFLIGQLALLGYRNKLDSITILPFGLPGYKPTLKKSILRGTKINETDFLLVWGGGIWDWFDPQTLLKALSKIKQTRNDIKTYFPGLRPPNPDSGKMAVVDAFLKEAERLGLLGNTVFVNTAWSSYEERADYLLEANAGISLHKNSIETRFAFRTRILDYLWAGLPMIASKGDSWADLIENNGMGLTVFCGDVENVVHAILQMADNEDLSTRCRKNTERIAGEYTWDNLVTRLP